MFQLRQVASLSCHDVSFCKVFQKFIVLVRLMYFCVIVLEIVVLNFSHNYACGFVMNCQRGRLLGSCFLCNWLIF